MTSNFDRLFRLMLFSFILAQIVCVNYGANGFSMIQRYEPDEEYSLQQQEPQQQLREVIDYEYADELPPDEIPAKRQQNQGGTCTCTCETRPVNEEPAKPPRPATAQYQETGSFLRTGAGVRPQSASRVLERPVQPKSSTEIKSGGHGDYHSKMVKGPPWDYYGMEQMKAENQMGGEEEEEKASDVKTTKFPDTVAETSDEHDSWGHKGRFPWKHLPNTMCFRESCTKDSDCCMRYNLCDKSAKVCVDCWYGSICKSEKDCCQRFPYCKMPSKIPSGVRMEDLPNGKCVNKE